MNPTIRIQTPTGTCTTFEFDESIVLRELSPRRLLELMMAFYQAHTFTELTSLDLLPLSGDLAKAWQNERHISWSQKMRQPTVEWRFEERLAAAVAPNGPPIAVVHGNVVLSVFSRIVGEFFAEPAALTAVRRS